MVIDAHVHFWRYAEADYPWIDVAMGTLRRDRTMADLTPVMAGAGVDACVAVQARQTLAETTALLAQAALDPRIRGVVGWAPLSSPDITEILAGLARDHRLVGLRHVVQDEPDPRFLLHSAFQRGIAALARTDLAWDLLVRPPQWAAALEFADRHSAQRMVLDHLGKPDIRAGGLAAWRAWIGELAQRGNVSVKISGLVTEADPAAWSPEQLSPYVDIALDAFGAQRAMVGSDWPVCTLGVAYGRWFELIRGWCARLTADERDAVLSGNATRFYRLPGAAR